MLSDMIGGVLFESPVISRINPLCSCVVKSEKKSGDYFYFITTECCNIL